VVAFSCGELWEAVFRIGALLLSDFGGVLPLKALLWSRTAERGALSVVGARHWIQEPSDIWRASVRPVLPLLRLLLAQFASEWSAASRRGRRHSPPPHHSVSHLQPHSRVASRTGAPRAVLTRPRPSRQSQHACWTRRLGLVPNSWGLFEGMSGRRRSWRKLQAPSSSCE